ncbi:pyridine nucleotide-disulfide oxidoreductase [Pseudactinotalea sp. HY160]|uniref:NAD(P)/FAD-dependent oxidoreductase n=1 Tax=Pseudactinotalea sp. HY160 TaxID=2654490 RepID=UPI00128D1BD8|nr:pyridine nucleotide-disulfide oxidoreductase [Pseudactinotalea sp. HY160]
MNRIVIVGAGLAGLRTATELRERGYDGEVVVIGDEPHPPYDRPPLSSELLTRAEPLWLADDLGTALADVADRVITGRAARLEPGAESVVIMDDGARLEASAVVLAMGSAPVRRWPEPLTLHTLEDAALLRAALASPARLAIIGAGWIGSEVAGQAGAAGHEVTVFEAGPAPLADHIGVRAGDYTRAWHEAAGVDLRTDTPVHAVDPAGGTGAGLRAIVRTGDGDIEADAVLAATGVRPNTDWLAGSGIPVTERGFVPVTVDGRVSPRDATVEATGADAPRVWAVGDVALRDHPRHGPLAGGHWFSALRDPAGVAAGILGPERAEPAPNLLAPEVFSDQFGHHLERIGDLAGPGGTEVLRGDPGAGWTLLQLRGDRLVGAIVADSPRDTSAVRKAFQRAGEDYPGIDLDLATDLAVQLRKALT